jgi:hypothetical protein
MMYISFSLRLMLNRKVINEKRECTREKEEELNEQDSPILQALDFFS